MKSTLPLCLLLFAGLTPAAFGQTTQGFSSDTQPEIVFQTAYIRESLRDSLLNGKLPVVKNAEGKPTTALVTRLVPHVVSQPNDDYSKEVAIPAGQVDIAADARLLAAYDSVDLTWTTNSDLHWWLPQVVADGDFNRLSGNTLQSAPKAGTIGLDAVRMKGIYREYTYMGTDEATGNQLPTLSAWRNVFQPQITVTFLFTLFGQGTPLSSGVKPGKSTQRATRDVMRTFGQTLLAPGGLSQNGNSGLLSASWFPFLTARDKKRTRYLRQVSLEGTILYAQGDWSTRDSTTTVNILAPSIGIAYRVFDRFLTSSQNQTQIRLFVRYSWRHMFGDIQDQPQLLNDVFNSTQRTYKGYEIGATASTSAIRVTISGGLFNGDIAGFSNGQVVYGLGLAAGIRL